MCSSEAFWSIPVHFSVSSPVHCKSQYNKSLLTPFIPVQNPMLYFPPSCQNKSYASVEMQSLSSPPSLLSLLSTTDRQEKKCCSNFPHLPLTFPEGFGSKLETSRPVSPLSYFFVCGVIPRLLGRCWEPGSGRLRSGSGSCCASIAQHRMLHQATSGWHIPGPFRWTLLHKNDSGVSEISSRLRHSSEHWSLI